MPLASEFPHPRRRARVRFARTLPALFAALALLALPKLAMAWASTMDPVFVFYPRDFCSGERIALEVWRRDEQRWVKHPRHPVVPVDSCQLEDAGVLLNEIRWRCLEPDRSDPDQGWNVGVLVFEPSVMQRCDVTRTGDGFGETEIHVSTPKPGETISDADGNLAPNVTYLSMEDLVLPYWLLKYEEFEEIFVDRSNPLHINVQVSFLRTALLE